MAKKILNVIGLCTLLMICVLVILDMNNNAIIHQIGGSYYNIKIPDDVTLVVVRNLTIEGDNGEMETRGTYNIVTKTIKLKFGDYDDMRSTLTHELAHNTYYYNLTNEEIDKIKSRYNYFCQDESEFYAYTIQHYGYFDYD